MKRSAPLALALALCLTLMLACASSSSAAVSNLSVYVLQSPDTPSTVHIDYSYDQPEDTPANFEASVIAFAATAWTGCSGAWPNGTNHNPLAAQVDDYQYPANHPQISGTSTLTIPAGYPLCVGLVAFTGDGDIQYKAKYIKFDKPSAINNGEPEKSPTSLEFPLDVHPQGLPTTYFLEYFKQVTTEQCIEPSDADLEGLQQSDSVTIADDMQTSHSVSVALTNLQPETNYCVAIRASNAQGNDNGFFWGYYTTSPPPEVANESYVGGNGLINYTVDVTPMSTLSDAALHFQYFKKVGDTCTLVGGEDTIYNFPALSPNRGTESVHVTASVDNLDPHTDYCIRAFATNAAGASSPGDFYTVRSVLKLPITLSYSYLANSTTPGDVALNTGFEDRGAYEDTGIRGTFEAKLYRVDADHCNAEGIDGESSAASTGSVDFDDDGTAQYLEDFDPGARGTANCIYAVAKSGWGHGYDSEQYIPFISGERPAFNTPTISHTAHSITLNANLDPGELQTNYSVFYVKPENGESCGTLTPTTHPEGTISADLSDDHAVSATVTGLDDGATYCALFSASNWLGQGFTNYLETTTTDATAPSRPAGLAASSVTKTSSTISWPGATDNVGVTGYRVYREGDLLTTTTDPSTNVSSVCGETAHFIVTAVDGAGNESEPSDAFTLHAAACDPPPLPGGGAAKSCFVKQAPKTLKLKKNRKTVKATVTSTVAADGQSVTVTAKAKGAKITFKVDSKGVTPNKGSIVVTGKTSVAAVTFKLIGKARTVSLHFTSSAC